MHSDDILQFIWAHRLDDPASIALSAKKRADLPMAYIAGQIGFLQKIQKKVPTWYRPGLRFPVALSFEQASSEATARFKAALITGQKMADLSGGLGVDSFFFAQHFSSVTYVEPNAELNEIAAWNFRALGAENIYPVVATAEEFLRDNPESFDLLYVDPSRRNEKKGKVLLLQDCSPNILEIKGQALEKSPRVLLKTAPLLDLQLAIRQLEHVSQVWVVASGNECKEVLYLLELQRTSFEEVPIHAVELNQHGEAHAFHFTWREEQTSDVQYTPPQQFLYEPNAAILKAGAFRAFARRYGLAKLHANTHLYTSAQLVTGIPGRSFVIEAVTKYDRKAVQALLPAMKANVATRNFPDSADVVRKKLGLADGGDAYLFAFTDVEGKKVVAVCRKA